MSWSTLFAFPSASLAGINPMLDNSSVVTADFWLSKYLGNVSLLVDNFSIFFTTLIHSLYTL